MLFIDTNVLLCVSHRESEQHEAARKALEKAVDRESWALSWNVVYEFVRVATHANVFSNPLSIEQAHSFLSELIERPEANVIQETSEHFHLFDQCSKESRRVSGNAVHDFHIAVLMREHGIEDILTFDRDFLAFPWIKVINPKNYHSK